MNAFKLFTLTANSGLHAMAGATFELKRNDKGRHFVGSEQDRYERVYIDIDLLLGPGVRLVDRAGANGDRCEITLSRVGLAQDDGGNTVFVRPEERNEPFVSGLTGLCDPAILWMPEKELSAVDNGESKRECCWLMPGLVRFLAMTKIWLEWRDPGNRNRNPETIRVVSFNGDIQATLMGTAGFCDSKSESTLRPFVAEHCRYRLPPRGGGRGVSI